MKFESELVCSKYKYKKLNDELWYIMSWSPWGEAEYLTSRVHEIIQTTPKRE